MELTFKVLVAYPGGVVLQGIRGDTVLKLKEGDVIYVGEKTGGQWIDLSQIDPEAAREQAYRLPNDLVPVG